MPSQVCEKCNEEMIIDEWNGWVWYCFHCGETGRNATDEEIVRHEKECVEIMTRRE